MDVTGANVFDVARQAVRLPARARLHAHPARRRDQPRHAQDAVGAARGDGGAHRHRRRHDARAGGAVPGARDDEPARSRGHLRAARGADRSLHGDARDRLPVARRRGARARRPPRRDVGARGGAAGDLARGVPRLARHRAAHPRRARGQARRGRLRERAAPRRARTARRSARAPRWRGCAPRRRARCSSGREFVTIDDLLDVAPDVLRHRLWTDAATVRERLRAVAIARSARDERRRARCRLARWSCPPLLVALVRRRARPRRACCTPSAPALLGAVARDGRRARDALASQARGASRRPSRSPWAQLDVLTAPARAMVWTGAARARRVGDRRLGEPVACSACSGSAIVYARGDVDRARRRRRRAVAARDGHARGRCPALATEGDPLREELRARAACAIPPGFRLFAPAARCATARSSRYVVDADGVAAARCGSRASSARRGAASTRAAARAVARRRARPHALRGRAPRRRARSRCCRGRPRRRRARAARRRRRRRRIARPTQQLPTEGTFRIREYAPGDDARRIHWVRSLQRTSSSCGLPDEIPPREPAVRLVLDTSCVGAETLTCRAPDELLDALVRVWLGVGKALVDAGTRVTLVAAVDQRRRDRARSSARCPARARARRAAARRARAVAGRACRSTRCSRDARAAQIVVSAGRGASQRAGACRWIVVPEVAWTSTEPPLPRELAITLPFPSARADNRTRPPARERSAASSDVARPRDVQPGRVLDRLVAVLRRSSSRGRDDGRVALEVIP